jgi:deoxyinosine 3'endonuclease (endonuclease V)
MESGGRPDFGVCAAVDVHYLSTGGARAAAVLAADAAFAHLLADRTALVPRVPPYRPGQFYRRELPPLHDMRTNPRRRPGLGKPAASPV